MKLRSGIRLRASSRLLTSVLLASASTLAGQAALGQTLSITASQTTPVYTATAVSGGNGAIDITSTGSVNPTSGAAVTLNSNNNVSVEGTITIDNASQAAGILAYGGNQGTITVSGTITLTDSTLATQIPLTQGQNRYGIQVQGTGALNGYIYQSGGTISILGNESAGILVGSPIYAAPASGGLNAITTAGAISVTGDNSYGLLILGPVSGTGAIGTSTVAGTGGVAVLGAVTAYGQNSSAIALGAVAGQVYLDSTVTSDGYYNGGWTTARPGKVPTTLGMNDFEMAGSAVVLGGSVNGGVVIDKSATVTTYGSSPTVLISGGANIQGLGAFNSNQAAPASDLPASITIGAGTNGSGLSIVGTVTSNGIYDLANSTAIQIGQIKPTVAITTTIVDGGVGTNGIDKGSINITGTVSSTAYAANASAISIQSGTAVGTTLTNSGTIEATVGYGANTYTTLGGTARAILDSAGALSLITNTGKIITTSASGTADEIAIDLRSNTAGVTVTQEVLPGSTTVPSITGSIMFGSGNANLNLLGGTLDGAVAFESGANSLTLNNGFYMNDSLTQLTGGTLALNLADGRLVLSNLVATPDATTLNTQNTLNLSSLNIGAKSEIDFALDPATRQNVGVNVVTSGVGAVVISPGARIGIDLDTQLTSPETFTLIRTPAGGNDLAGQSSLVLGEVPYFYVANLVTNDAQGTIAVNLRDRTFAQAGVAGNAAAYDAIFQAYDRDPGVFTAIDRAATQQAFKAVYNQELPSFSGGLFNLLSKGADSISHAEVNSPVALSGDSSGGWAEQLGFAGNDNSSSGAPGYHGGGLGLAFGWETPASPISTIGIAAAYLRGSLTNAESGPGSREVGTAYTVGAYWREVDGPFHANGSLNAGVAEFDSQRAFAGNDADNVAFVRDASTAWSGGVAHAHAGVDYEQALGDTYFIRPGILGDYFVLYQDSHAEHNGGPAMDLSYGSGVGKQGSGTGQVTFGGRFGDTFVWRPEITVGWRQYFGGPDNTVAQFISGGPAFSLTPPTQKGGAIARIGFHAGNKYTDIAFEVGGEERGSYRTFDGALVARFRF